MWPFGINNKYPYTDFHELNTDYLIEKTGKIDQNLQDSETAREGAETAQEAAETAQAAAETAQESAETAEDNTEEYYNNLVTHIADDVTDWLNDNVNPVGAAVVVDSSLTVSGAAADAKVVGDEVNDLKSDLFNVTDDGYISVYSEFARGGLKDGLPTNHSYRVYTTGIMRYGRNITIVTQDGFRVGVALYDDTDTFMSQTGWITTLYDVPSNTGFKIVIARITENTQEVADLAEFRQGALIATFATDQLEGVINASVQVPQTLTAGTGTVWGSGFTEAPSNFWARLVDPDHIINYYRVYLTLTSSINYLQPNTWYYFETFRSTGYGLQLLDGGRIRDDNQQTLGGTVTFEYIKTEKSLINGERLIDKSIYDQKLSSALQARTRKHDTTYITSAHRGVFYPISNEYPIPMNTIPAFIEAYKSGVDMIECDARLTYDGQLICCHDDAITINNTTYNIASTTFDVITSLQIGYTPTYGSIYVPSIEEVLLTAYKLGLKVNLDLKNPGDSVNVIMPIVKRTGMLGRIIYGLNNASYEVFNSILAQDLNAECMLTKANAELYIANQITPSKIWVYTSSPTTEYIATLRGYGVKINISEVSKYALLLNAIDFCPDMIEFTNTDIRSLLDMYVDDYFYLT